jgi:hypothetical protein
MILQDMTHVYFFIWIIWYADFFLRDVSPGCSTGEWGNRMGGLLKIEANLKRKLWDIVENSLDAKLNSEALVGKRTISTEWPPHVGEVSTNFANRGCGVVSATDSLK